MSPVIDGLRDRPEQKPITMDNYYAAINYTDPFKNDNAHIIIQIQLHGARESVNINAMIDSGATQDLIEQDICNKHGIKMIRATSPREI